MKKITTIILIWCLLLEFCGCYTPHLMSKEELYSRQDSDIIIKTKGKTNYSMDAGSYSVCDDTINGVGSLILENGAKVKLDGTQKMGTDDVESVQVQQLDAAKTILAGAVCIGLAVLTGLGINSLMKSISNSVARGIGDGLSQIKF